MYSYSKLLDEANQMVKNSTGNLASCKSRKVITSEKDLHIIVAILIDIVRSMTDEELTQLMDKLKENITDSNILIVNPDKYISQFLTSYSNYIKLNNRSISINYVHLLYVICRRFQGKLPL